ncbi:ceramide synthase 2 isoform 2-T3 [Morphnus guianensis]
MFQTLYSYFWWERLWLPANLTWADLEDRDGRVYAKASDLYITLPLAFLFLVIRHLFETYVATPLAGLLNVKEKIRLKATPNAVLEKFYAATTKHPKQADVEMLSKKSGCTVRQVERWFRRRRNQDRPSLLKKFREASWRFTFYLIAFIAGMAVIVDKPWFYDLREVWKGYPIQSMLPSQYWYYMIELSFYWSLLFSIASDVKRKDFKEQIIHHVATIILISFSWFANYIRAGTLIMALHDSSDYLLESAKMFNYAGWRNTCNNIFIVFAAVFIVTRLVILPFWWWRTRGVTVKRRTTRRRRRRQRRTGPSPTATLSSTTTTAKPTERPHPVSALAGPARGPAGGQTREMTNPTNATLT